MLQLIVNELKNVITGKIVSILASQSTPVQTEEEKLTEICSSINFDKLYRKFQRFFITVGIFNLPVCITRCLIMPILSYFHNKIGKVFVKRYDVQFT